MAVYREELKEEEDQFWATGKNAEIVQRRIVAPIAAHPVAIVICPGNQLLNLRHPKVKFVGNYVSSINTSCPEAIMAQQHGQGPVISPLRRSAFNTQPTRQSMSSALPGFENPRGCICNLRYELLYKENCNQNLQTKDGVMDFSNFDEEESRKIVECSDACGCSSSCSRRNLQRGQQKLMVVFREENKGFTLRADADIVVGELTGEYTGRMKFFRDGKDHSHEAELKIFQEGLVICAISTGNAIRVLSHSCEPNAIFVPIHSRLLESDALLPKIAVFALKPIKLSEEMTISYYERAS